MCSRHRPTEGADSAYLPGETPDALAERLGDAVNADALGPTIPERLEELRQAIRSESISYSEFAELQGLAAHIDRSDVELREWAGIREFPDSEGDCSYCGAFDGEPCNPDCLSGTEFIEAVGA